MDDVQIGPVISGGCGFVAGGYGGHAVGIINGQAAFEVANGLIIAEHTTLTAEGVGLSVEGSIALAEAEAGIYTSGVTLGAAGAAAGLAGGITGYFVADYVEEKTDSKIAGVAAGTLSGAAVGAGVGFLIGGPAGAAVGAVAGGIAGFIGGLF
ncbi:hypothetical protein [Ekhidna sp.]